ncbi:hypothetical protein [Streptomyces sp. URMC 129]|uniref:hypothetical protein n=1 Tax=Streptomyces sp. URMC 129 TaxID=3423407 RepID=UPI003F1A2B7B
MARGRHRSSALHRVLAPAALGGLALLCAGGALLLGDEDAPVLRILVAVAAASAATCAALLRRWDLEAGRQVARERAAKAGVVWQMEEKQAELEEAQDLIGELEAKLRAKRADLGAARLELAGLRTEHADLLRRYATAESERAKALEGRRLLALEAAIPAKALTVDATDHRTARGAPTQLTYRQAHEALIRLSRNAARQREAARHQAPQAPPQAEQTQQPQQAPEAQYVPPPQRPATPATSRRVGGFDFFGTGAQHR